MSESDQIAALRRQLAELEHRLQVSEARFSTLVDGTGDGVFMVDAEGRFLFVNDFIAQSSGFPAAAFVGRHFLELILPEHHDLVRTNFARALAGEFVPAYELAYATSSSDEMWVEINTAPVTIDGETSAVLGISRNIQARRSMELALRESEEKYRSLVDTLPHAVAIVQDSELVFANVAAGQMLGLRAPADAATMFGVVAPEDRQRLREMLQRRMAGDQSLPLQYDATIRTADGRAMSIEVNARPVRYGGRPATQYIAVDLSERKKLEEQLLQSQKMEALGTLAGGVAHDFNNLLTGILGMAGMVKQKSPGDPEIHRSAELIERAALRAATLTEKLLGFARKSRPDRRAVDLNGLIDDLAGILGRTIDKRIRLALELDPDCGPAHGDAAQLQQLVMNLAINARDAMPDGGTLTIATRRVELTSPSLLESFEISAGPYLQLTVQDSGTGIAKDVLERVFEPFFTTKPQGQGSGMGLSLVYGVVRNHHGAIQLDSQPDGGGTTVLVYIPPAASDALDTRSQERPAPSGQGVVLVVDDEEILLETARLLLENLGYDVLLCRDGFEALTRYRESHERVDVALIDISMPGMNGWACLSQLRQINSGLRAVMTSGYGADLAGQSADQPHEFIAKPYLQAELARVLARAIAST